MPFRMTEKCRKFFSDITAGPSKSNVENKLSMLFDGYYLCLLVGLAKVEINNNTEFENTAFIDEYPTAYQNAGVREYIAGLLISTEASRKGANTQNEAELEKLMSSLISAESVTRLTLDGEDLLNQYAARGIDIMMEKMMPGTPSCLEDFFQDYFDCFESGAFLN